MLFFCLSSQQLVNLASKSGAILLQLKPPHLCVHALPACRSACARTSSRLLT
jgi:hypothetical protein